MPLLRTAGLRDHRRRAVDRRAARTASAGIRARARPVAPGRYATSRHRLRTADHSRTRNFRGLASASSPRQQRPRRYCSSHSRARRRSFESGGGGRRGDSCSWKEQPVTGEQGWRRDLRGNPTASACRRSRTGAAPRDRGWRYRTVKLAEPKGGSGWFWLLRTEMLRR